MNKYELAYSSIYLPTAPVGKDSTLFISFPMFFMKFAGFI